MLEAEVKKLKVDVARHFKHPDDIVNNDELATEQKITLLKEWEVDLRQLMVASEENMQSDGKPGATADTLMKVSKALETLGGQSAVSTEHTAPTKLGG